MSLKSWNGDMELSEIEMFMIQTNFKKRKEKGGYINDAGRKDIKKKKKLHLKDTAFVISQSVLHHVR